MKERFFSWFEAKEDESALTVVIKGVDPEKDSVVKKLSAKKVFFVALPAIVIALVLFVKYFVPIVFFIGLLVVVSAVCTALSILFEVNKRLVAKYRFAKQGNVDEAAPDAQDTNKEESPRDDADISPTAV